METTPSTSATNHALPGPRGHVLRKTSTVPWFAQCCLRFEPVVLVSRIVVHFIIIENKYVYFTRGLTIGPVPGSCNECFTTENSEFSKFSGLGL